jgi:hypothetical protein
MLERKEGRTLEILVPSSWRLTSPIKAEPGRSVASLATASVTTSAMRRHASAWAVQFSLENVLPVVHGVNKPEDRITVVVTGQDDSDTGGVAEHGTSADDGPVTWEALISPREECRQRGPDDKSPTRPRHGCTRCSDKNKHPTMG